jgi:hypothetical protein
LWFKNHDHDIDDPPALKFSFNFPVGWGFFILKKGWGMGFTENVGWEMGPRTPPPPSGPLYTVNFKEINQPQRRYSVTKNSDRITILGLIHLQCIQLSCN